MPTGNQNSENREPNRKRNREGGGGWVNVFPRLPNEELIEDWGFRSAEKELTKNIVKATLHFYL